MRSEQLMRFESDNEAVRRYGNEHAREEISNQVEAFLANGGQIQRVGNELNVRPNYQPRSIAMRAAG